ncbi:hypothetical protein GJR99_14740 [Haloferax sp. MBLA0078]|uniref:Uncharacterized protein n=1 Tax=Haloferax marinum TaxID=2666143 RepID=A0A6A8GAS1_9EURY|nr:hypothetical protein Hfx1150_14740 [Haloferax sp. CBA1150]MRW97825.1 hypothetical protein [Haloferax marinum]
MNSVSRPSLVASVLTLVLTVVATAVGLFVPDFYRDAPALVTQVYGQDALTLAVAVPVLAGSLYAAVRGSLRGYVVWLGVTGYLLYTYASYAFMTAFNELYLVYVALFALTLVTLVGGILRLDATALRDRMRAHSVRSDVVFQVTVAVVVAALWLAEIIPATLAGTVPASIRDTGVPVNVIHTLDLAVFLPALLLSAYWLWQRDARGYVLTGVLLVKATTLGLAVLSMIGFMVLDGQAVVLPQVLVFGAFSLVGLVLVGRFVSAIESTPATTTTRSTTPAGEIR